MALFRMVVRRKVTLALLMVAGIPLQAARAEHPGFVPDQSLYGLYRICGSIEGARTLHETAAQTVADDDLKSFGAFFRNQSDCSAKVLHLSVVREEPAFSGKLSWNVIYDPKSPENCEAKGDGSVRMMIPCTLVKQRARYYYVRYLKPNGQTIILLAETFESNVVEQYLRKTAP